MKPDTSEIQPHESDKLSEQTLKLMYLLGQTDSEGRLREEGRDKIAQVLAFLPLLKKVVARTSRRKPLNILECASGKGHLSLLMNQILTECVDREVRWVGIDSSARLITKCRSIADTMGYDNVEYHRSKITDYQDDRTISVLLSLHACDTATDEALVKGLELGCRYIFLVPCCQREVSNQLSNVKDPMFIPLIENYTHRKILGSVLTDALRRLALESFGYKVDIFEYVSVRRTEKNIMIRGVFGKVPSERSWSLFQGTLHDLDLDLTLERILKEKGIHPPFNPPHGAASSHP